MKLPAAALAALETAINGALALDPLTPPRLAELAGRVIAVQVTDLDLTLYLVCGPLGMELLGTYEGEPDATIRGSSLALLGQGIGDPDQGAAVMRGEVELLGDTRLAQRMQRILREMEIDWEGHLARLTGDLVAHQVGRLARAGFGWLGDTRRSLEADLREYLEEELRLLPAAAEMEQFLEEVDETRAWADRLEARLRLLEQRPEAEGGAAS